MDIDGAVAFLRTVVLQGLRIIGKGNAVIHQNTQRILLWGGIKNAFSFLCYEESGVGFALTGGACSAITVLSGQESQVASATNHQPL
jgi:hypothetical protein